MPIWIYRERTNFAATFAKIQPLVCLLVQYDLLRLGQNASHPNDDSRQEKKSSKMYSACNAPCSVFCYFSFCTFDFFYLLNSVFFHCFSLSLWCRFFSSSNWIPELVFRAMNVQVHGISFFCIFRHCRLFYNYCNGCWALCKDLPRLTHIFACIKIVDCIFSSRPIFATRHAHLFRANSLVVVVFSNTTITTAHPISVWCGTFVINSLCWR